MAPVADQVVVVTGASSGIGRATALRFAAQGARVVLASRNGHALQTLAEAMERHGLKAHVVPTDVADWEQVQHLAAAAIAHFGHIDTWVNNAAVAIYATAVDTTVDEAARLLDVNLLGQIHGVKAVLPHMIERGTGTIINVGSVESERALPYHSVYAASKHGIKGFTEGMRVEMARDYPGIKVVLIQPGSINTPLFRHALSRLGGVKPLPMPPIYEPGAVAAAIVSAAEQPQAQIYVGSASRTIAMLNRISPPLVDRLLLAGDAGFRFQRNQDPDDGTNNLFAPLDDEPGAVEGEYGKLSRPVSIYTSLLELHPERKPLLGVALLGALLLLLRRR